MELSDLIEYQEVELPVNASYACSRISVEQLLALRLGSVVVTEKAPGENADIRTGDVLIGNAELGWREGSMIARLVAMAEKAR